ncbi:MAG: BMC domain-containing protein [Planctomycetota bacterium]|nr:MAG: BMC domain-containing protein [Planctomycetota bacterium]
MSRVELRTYTHIDVFQPQVASFLATVARGFLPVEGQAALVIEIAPGMDVNVVMDVALKRTNVRPGMMIVERVFGMMELHSHDQGEVRAAGEAVLGALGLSGPEDRLRPRIQTTQVITGVDAHHSMLINRMRHGNFLLENDAFYILEVHPAGYAIFAANEAEKAAEIEVLEILSFGAFGRVFLGGSESNIQEAARAVENALEAVSGRPNEGARAAAL